MSKEIAGKIKGIISPCLCSGYGFVFLSHVYGMSCCSFSLEISVELPRVSSVFPDCYEDVENKKYGGRISVS